MVLPPPMTVIFLPTTVSLLRSPAHHDQYDEPMLARCSASVQLHNRRIHLPRNTGTVSKSCHRGRGHVSALQLSIECRARNRVIW